MSGGPLNNGVEIQGLTILCIPDGPNRPVLMHFTKGLANAFWPGPGNGPTMLRVVDDATGRTLATKRFRRRSQATETRSILVAAVEQMGPEEFASTDWQVLTDAI